MMSFLWGRMTFVLLPRRNCNGRQMMRPIADGWRRLEDQVERESIFDWFTREEVRVSAEMSMASLCFVLLRFASLCFALLRFASLCLDWSPVWHISTCWSARTLFLIIYYYHLFDNPRGQYNGWPFHRGYCWHSSWLTLPLRWSKHW